MSGAEFGKLYYDAKHPSGYGSIRKLYSTYKKGNPTLRVSDVIKWLSGEDTYTLHKQIRRKFPRRKTISSGYHHQYQADLIQLNNLSRYNDDHRFILTVIDVFSRQAFVAPIRRKTGDIIANALEKIIKMNGARCRLLQTDDGAEFFNQNVQRLLKRYQIKHFSTSSDLKSSLVERFNRTLLDKIFKWMSKNNTYRYIDVLNDLVHSYNHSHHRIIGMRPIDVSKQNEKYCGQN